MNWSDEHYVKLYTRDTATWLSWPWQARCVFPLLMRKLDGAGLLASGRLELTRAVAVMISIPEDVVAPAIAALIEDGTIEQVSSGLLVPKFLEAQEARKSDKLRAAEYRARERDSAKSAKPQLATVTERHRPSLSSPALPCPALPNKDLVGHRTDEHPLAAAWNTSADKSLPRWPETRGRRKTAADARLKEHPDIGWWLKVIARLNASAFLLGASGRSDWRANPDWLLKPNSATKVLEGHYDNGPPRASKGPVDPTTQSHTEGPIAL